MCDLSQYYLIYYANLNDPSPRKTRLVRLARELINEHRRTCPECRYTDTTGTNYNLAVPKQSRMGRRP